MSSTETEPTALFASSRAFVIAAKASGYVAFLQSAFSVIGRNWNSATSEAQDAVQEAFLAFLEKAPQNLEIPGAWLMRVLVNGCKSRLRLRWRRPTVPLWEELPAPSPEEREELEELYALPPQDRAVIHLHYYEGYSTQEIAQLLHCRPGTVRSRLSRARERLRRLLGGDFQ